jgi:myo-inositol-1(or 4)-monophosphatase
VVVIVFSITITITTNEHDYKLDTTMSHSDLTQLLAVARETAVSAGNLIHEKWQQPRQTSSKGFRDLVTDADLAAQRLITDHIRHTFPQHGFLPEEENSDLPTEGEVIWVIDPVDGTTNYSRQLPIFCVSIAAALPGVGPVVGVVYDPMRQECFSGAKGEGAWLNGRSLQVSPVADLGQAIIGLDWSHSQTLRQSTLDSLPRFAHQVYTVRAFGSAALALAWVAAGRLDGYLNYNLKPWDTAAAGLLIAEAGGRLSHVATNAPTIPWAEKNQSAFGSNGRIHHDFLTKIT